MYWAAYQLARGGSGLLISSNVEGTSLSRLSVLNDSYSVRLTTVILAG